MFKESKIYIAGHTGLLGTALHKRLNTLGYSNILTKSHSDLDLTDQAATDEFIKTEKPEYIFMAAGLTGGIIANKTQPASFLHTNIAMQDNVFEAANNYDVKQLLFYGSSCIYPRDCSQPMKEEHLFTGKIEETSEAYAIAKTAGILACKGYNSQFGKTKFVALVPNSMYGPNDNFDLDNSHVLAALIRKVHDAKMNKEEELALWGTGEPRREFIYSEDCADASIFTMEHADKLDNSHYNVGSGTDHTIKELAKAIVDIISYDGKIVWDTTKPNGTPRKLLDSSKFNSLGWKPSTALQDGLNNTYEWFLKNSNSRAAV